MGFIPDTSRERKDQKVQRWGPLGKQKTWKAGRRSFDHSRELINGTGMPSA